MYNYLIIRMIVAVLLLTSPAVVSAQDHDEATSSPPAKSETQLIATIVGIEGLVSLRDTEGQPWRRATKGMRLSQGGELRTGPRSYVKFVIPPDQIVLLDRLSTIKLLQAVFDGAKRKSRTDLGMKYGRTRYEIEEAGIEHESFIYSASAILGIRGTDVQISDNDGFPTTITSHRGRIVATLRGFEAISIGGTKKATVTDRHPTPGLKARADGRLDPISKFSGRTKIELKLFETHPGPRPVSASDKLRQSRPVRARPR